jgi:hypothetical protein
MLTPDVHTRRLLVAERQASLLREARLAALAASKPEEPRERTTRRVLRRRLRTA